MKLPALTDLFDRLGRVGRIPDLLAALTRGANGEFGLAGVNETAAILYAALLHKTTDRPVVFLTDSNPHGDAICEALTAFLALMDAPAHRGAPFLVPAHDVTPYDGLSPHADINERRAMGLWRLADGQASIAVVPVASALMKVASRDFYKNLTWRIVVGDEFFLEDLESGLASVGYTRREPVELVGHFSVRGGIVDVFSPESDYPVRIEMAGDEVETIRVFDPDTQKSVRSVEQALLLPLSDYPVPGEGDDEPLLSGWEFTERGWGQRESSVFDLPVAPIVIWHEPAVLRKSSESFAKKLAEARKPNQPETAEYFLSLDALRSREDVAHVLAEQLALEETGGITAQVRTQPAPQFSGRVSDCMREVQAQTQTSNRVLLTAPSVGDVERLTDILGEFELAFQIALPDATKATIPYLREKAGLTGPVAATVLAQAALRHGAIFPDQRIVLYGYEDIFPPSELVAAPAKRKAQSAAFLAGLEDLKTGDLVVHAEHGIGKYQGIQQVDQGPRKEDLMVIEYANNARLFVPLARLDLVQPYQGAGGKAPTLDKMGGQSWKKTTAKVKARLRDMADELLKLYAQRKMSRGFSFSPDSNWQREFEDSFPYTPTKDQAEATTDIKRDMESTQPMDRLVCGDVGFGKTEVAMRAAFKALGDGKQVAVLAPTTVLAFQHYETFRQRFRSFPAEIDMLTRFRTNAQQKETIERLNDGKIDIVIGTHRILSKDVEYADLGLVIVDEEQRFGVRHKERLKALTKSVDVLTMTATPIPRTLHMSLVGLRDLSVIQTPPKDRLAIHTVVAPFSDAILRTALEQEISRGGQAYVIHNRVETIWEMGGRIQGLLPNVRIGVGHGQMPEKELESVVLKFMHHKYDVLLATTIVENGLDIPLANTIVVNQAQNYGLSELYQLRGRVGRSNRRAYAYLLVPQDKELTDIARKRLAAMKEFSELGSGFKIAALDLELRGGGNLLGAEQSGQIASVGFETYCRMLDEQVRALRGEKVEEVVRTTLRLQLDLHIPPDYIADETQRLRTYKRLADIADADAAARIRSELRDRYGPLPEAVDNLVQSTLLKVAAESLRIEAIERRSNRVKIRFREDSKIEPALLTEFMAKNRGASFSPTGELEWKLSASQETALLDTVEALLRRFGASTAELAPAAGSA